MYQVTNYLHLVWPSSYIETKKKNHIMEYSAFTYKK